MISAILESRLQAAEWDAECARVAGDMGRLLDAVAEIELLNAERARLSDVSWLEALRTEM